MRLLPAVEGAAPYRKAAMAGTLTEAQLVKWGDLITTMFDEWEGAAAVLASAPPVRGSSGITGLRSYWTRQARRSSRTPVHTGIGSNCWSENERRRRHADERTEGGSPSAHAPHR